MLPLSSLVCHSSALKCLCQVSNIQLAFSNGDGPGSTNCHAERPVKLEEGRRDLRERWILCAYFF